MLVLGFQRGPDDARGGVVDEHVERTELRGLRGNPLGRDVPAQEERLRPGRAQLLGGLLGGPVVAEVADRDPRRPSLSEPQRDRLADSTRATGHQDRGAVEAHRRGGSGWSAGSALCGVAQNMVELVIFRAVQGVGAGGLFPLTLAMVGMIVPPRDRGRYQGLIGSVFAAASIIGPLVGGFIVDNLSWRWIFYVNLPVGGVALAVILVTMPKRPYEQEHSIDWLGAGILALGTTSLLLGLVWGGRDYPWGSPQVVGALVAAVVLLAVFAPGERRRRT